MPFVKRDTGVVGELDNQDIFDEQEKRDIATSEVFGAAFRLENTAVSAIVNQNANIDNPTREIDTTFDPFEMVEGYEDFADSFVNANTPEEVDIIKRQIDRELDDRKILQESGATGFVASLAAGVIDPINLIPVGGAAYKTYRAGGSVLQGAVATGMAGALGATAAEAALHHTQVTRTFGESAANVAGAALLSGVLGGAAAKLSKAIPTDIPQRIEEELVVPKDDERDLLDGGFISLDGGTAGAAQARIVTEADVTVADALKVEKLLSFQDPLIRTTTKGLFATKRAVSRLVESPLKSNQNMTGQASSVPVETRVLQDNGELVDVIQNSRKQFLNYRSRMAGKTKGTISTAAEDMFGVSAKEGKLTDKQFREEVGRAMLNGSQHDIPEVAEASKYYREKFFEPWRKRLEEQGMLPEGVTDETATNYLMMVWDTDAIKTNRNILRGRLKEYLTQKREEAVVRVPEIERDIAKRRAELKEQVSKLSEGIKPTKNKIRKLESELKEVRFGKSDVEKKARDAINAELKGLREKVKEFDAQVKEARKARDAEVKSMQGEILKLNRDRQKFDEDIDFRAGQIIERILGTPAGRLPYDVDFSDLTQPGGQLGMSKTARPGPTKARALDIDPSMVEDFRVLDIEEVAKAYKRTISPDYHLKKEFGDVEMVRELEEIREEFDAKSKGLKDGSPELKKLEKRFDRDVKDLLAMRDRIRGVYGMPADPTSGFVRTGRVLRNLNFVTLMGGVAISSVPDIGSIILRNGMRNFLDVGLRNLATNISGLKLAGEELKLAGEAADMVLEGRAQILADIADGSLPGTRFERGLGNLSNAAGKVMGISQWNSGLKQFAGAVTIARMDKLTKRLLNGTASKREISDLAANFIDKRMARKIQAQIKEHGIRDGSLVQPNTSRWTDKEAVEVFRAGLAREIRATIVTPGQDKPLFMSNELGKLVGQFRSFAFASMQRVTLASLQNRDMQTLIGLTSMAGLGMMVHMIKEKQAGREINYEPEALIAEGIDRAGLTGWFFDANNTVEKMTGGGVGVSRLLGKQPQGRYQSRNAMDAVLGPSLGTATTIIGTTGAISRGEFNQQDTRAMRRLLPFQNHFLLRNIFDEAEKNLNDALGIPER